jgi:hypothetical protein
MFWFLPISKNKKLKRDIGPNERGEGIMFEVRDELKS